MSLTKNKLVEYIRSLYGFDATTAEVIVDIVMNTLKVSKDKDGYAITIVNLMVLTLVAKKVHSGEWEIDSSKMTRIPNSAISISLLP